MEQQKCHGCGARLQTTDPNQLGFVPAQVVEADKDLLCQRCFQITNYKRNNFGSLSPDLAIAAVKSGIELAEGLILVLDIMDFEGSLPAEVVDLVVSSKKPVIAVVNKGDLLPPRTSFSEVKEWVRNELRKRNISGHIVVIRALSGKGIAELYPLLFGNEVRKWAMIGSTNVGKSAIIQRILRDNLLSQEKTPTVSSFPGTTVDCLQWRLPAGCLLFDTPGIAPSGRISDQVCSKCAPKLIPNRSIDVKLYPIKKGTTFVIPSICSVEVSDTNPGTLAVCFGSPELMWHRTRATKIAEFLESGNCACNLVEWEKHSFTIRRNYDLAISGLGWISIRKGTANVEVTAPKGSTINVRPNLIGPKETLS